GTVFIELAREGRSQKLGFALVTQQPDPRSITREVAHTLDTVICFQVPPDDAKHLGRLKSGFNDEAIQLAVSSAPRFQGVAMTNRGPIFFKNGPVDVSYMRASAEHRLE